VKHCLISKGGSQKLKNIFPLSSVNVFIII
jgi:hypothetical protein